MIRYPSKPNAPKSSTPPSPLVNSISCTCIQSGVNPNAHRSRNWGNEILPGLPDDLAINCLIRVPRIEHRKMHLVCKSWNHLLSGSYFYSIRKSHGMTEEWVYVIKRDSDGRISLRAFDPIYQLWQPVLSVPWEYCETWGFGCAVLSGCHLYLFGGKHRMKGPVKTVIFYCVNTNKWYRAPDMRRTIHLLSFASCVINNCLYVASEGCERSSRALKSAEVYDPNQNRWNVISETSITRGPYIGFVHDGTWFLKGCRSSSNVMCEAYSPETDTWSPVSNGMVNDWSRNKFCISLYGQLYAVDSRRDECKVTVYDRATDSWKEFVDSRRLGFGTSMVALVPLNGKLCIILNNSSIIVVDVSSPNIHKESNSNMWSIGEEESNSDMWKTIAEEESNLYELQEEYGRRSSVIGCQVLEA